MMQNPHYDDSLNKGPKGDKGDPGPAGIFTTPTADVSFGNQKITNFGAPRDGTDAVNKNYTDSRYNRAGDDNMGSQKITNLGNPTNNKDAVNKEYVDRRFIVVDLMPSLGYIIIKHTHNKNQRTYLYPNGANISNYKFLFIRYHTYVYKNEVNQSIFSNTEFFPIRNIPTHISPIRLAFGAEINIYFQHTNFQMNFIMSGTTILRITIEEFSVLKYIYNDSLPREHNK